MGDARPAAGHEIEKHLSALESAIRNILAASPFKLNFSIQKAAPHPGDPDSPEYVVDFSGPDADLLVEMHAALLHAFEHVMLKAARIDDDEARRIAFDCKDWRRTRIGELQLMAQVAAERVIDTGSPFALNPMNARERRVVHLALKDNPQVLTQSEGVGPERKVVIVPKK
jgi:spoIIIJ-associated protein